MHEMIFNRLYNYNQCLQLFQVHTVEKQLKAI